MFFKKRSKEDREKSLIATLNREDRYFRQRYIDSRTGYFGFVGSIVLTVICLFLFVWTVVSTVRHLNIYNNGNQTMGTVHQVRRSYRSRGGVRYTTYIRYEVNNIERIQRLNMDFFGGGIGNPDIGTIVNIRYHPNNSNYIFRGTRNGIVANLIIYSVLCGGGLLFGVFGIRYRYLQGKQ